MTTENGETMDDRNPLTFRSLSAANMSRASRWHQGFPADDTWTGGDWGNALAGETGEACNIVKKIRRLETGKKGRATEADSDVLRAQLALELADVVTYADLLALKYGIDLADAVATKFNSVSVEYGFPERLPSPMDHQEVRDGF